MTNSEIQNKLYGDFGYLAGVIIQNNPEAVATNAVNLGYKSTTIGEEGLVELVNTLINEQDWQGLTLLLSVPFNASANNATKDYHIFLPKPEGNAGARMALDWAAIVTGAVGGALGGLLSGSQQNQQNQQPPAPLKKDNTTLYVVIGASVLVIVVLIVIFLGKKK